MSTGCQCPVTCKQVNPLDSTHKETDERLGVHEFDDSLARVPSRVGLEQDDKTGKACIVATRYKKVIIKLCSSLV